MIRVGVIGYGYWGANLVRNFAEATTSEVIAVADMKPDWLQLVARRYPGLETTTDYRDLPRNPKIDAFAISTHFLQCAKHVLAEKPITASSEDTLCQIDEVTRRNLFVYTHGRCSQSAQPDSRDQVGALRNQGRTVNHDE